MRQTREESVQFWAQVTAFGTLWGLLEMTVGSFLHTLRLPFTGTMLAALGAGLLVAQRQILPARGATLAIGIIAALCKSLSPGGIILNPMIGITVEAALVELALLPAPRAATTAALAGALSVSWALTQKFIMQTLFYGGAIVEIYLSALQKIASWISFAPGWEWVALAAAVSPFLLIGMGIGLLGRRIGRQVLAQLAAREAEAVP